MIHSGDFLVWYVGSGNGERLRRVLREMEKRHETKFGESADVVLVNEECPAVYLEVLRECGYRVERSRVVFANDMWMGRAIPLSPAVTSPFDKGDK